MVVIFSNGDVCEDAEYYGIFHDEELEEIKNNDNEYDKNYYINEDLIYYWKHMIIFLK